MWEKIKTKCRSFFSNRAAVIVTVMVLVTLTVAIAVTLSLNRAKKPTVSAKNAETTANNRSDEQTEQVTGSADRYESENTTAPIQNSSDENNGKPTDASPKYIIPVGGSLAKEHDTSIQVWSATTGDYRVHLGIDIATEEAADVSAVADGKVSKIWEDPMMGVCVALTHADETVSVYKNLSSALADGISEGAEVKSGQALGKVGNSAVSELADEPHLHFEMTVNGISVDPLDYLDRNSLTPDTSYEDSSAETSMNEESSATIR